MNEYYENCQLVKCKIPVKREHIKVSSMVNIHVFAKFDQIQERFTKFSFEWKSGKEVV